MKAFFMFIVMIVSVLNLNAQMRVHLINVGQGLAMLIEFPCAVVLVDAGGESNKLFNSSDNFKNYLDDFFNRRTDLNHTFQCVYITHPHDDHTLGIPDIMQTPYIIKNVVTDGLEKGSGKAGQIKLHRAVQAAEDNSDPIDDIGFQAVTTDEIGEEGLTNAVIDPVDCSGTNPVISVLWGTSSINPGWSEKAFNNLNNHSLVIKIKYGSSSLLITGDLEEAAQSSLLSKYSRSKILDADVYIVGHHGSKNGTSQELLEKITPEIALIGVGEPSRNILWTAWAYGHPNKGVLDMLQNILSANRSPIHVQAGTGAKKFVDYEVSKAIYATAWDNNVVLQADVDGHWNMKDESTIVPDKVNINNASESELETLPGIGATKAKAIIDYRISHGNFSSFDDLNKVPGIGSATIDLLKPYVKF